MESCENRIGSKLCGHDAHAKVFGVPMCASCISNEFQNEEVEGYIRSSRIGVVLAITTLISFAIRNIGVLDGIRLPKLRLPPIDDKCHKTAKLRKGGKVFEYRIYHDEIGNLGVARRDEVRAIWLAITPRGKVIDVSSSLDTAARILWNDYRRTGK